MRRMLCTLLLLALPRLAAGQTEPVQKAVEGRLQTIRYLRSLQQADGSFLPAAPDPKLEQQAGPSLRATSAAIRAIRYSGGSLPEVLGDRYRPCAAFVQRCFNEETGGFADRPGGKADVTTTAVGLMAAAELKLAADPFIALGVKYLAENARSFEEIRIAVAGMEAVKQFPPVVQQWHQQVLRLGNGDGTWGKDDRARATGGAIALLLRSGGRLDEQQRMNALVAMRTGQHADGGFGKDSASTSDLETSYRIMRAFHLLGEKPKDVKALTGYIARCRNADGGYGAAPGNRSTAGATYYAATILHWIHEK